MQVGLENTNVEWKQKDQKKAWNKIKLWIVPQMGKASIVTSVCNSG